MAKLIGTSALTLGATVTIKSFGNEYTGTVTELKARTALVRYVNKGGKTYELRVQRTDIAAPTAEQKDAAARGGETRRLNGDVKMWTRHVADEARRFGHDVNEENARRADEVAEHIATCAKYGWTISDWAARQQENPLTAEQWAAEQAKSAERVAELNGKIAAAKSRLAELKTAKKA